jgi:hypothetical protein
MPLTICVCLLVLLLQVPGQLLISHALSADETRLLLLLLMELVVPGWMDA